MTPALDTELYCVERPVKPVYPPHPARASAKRHGRRALRPKVLEQLTAGALRRACRSRGAQEEFLDPESGRDPTKEDLLAWLEENWGASSGASEPAAGSSEEDLAAAARDTTVLLCHTLCVSQSHRVH